MGQQPLFIVAFSFWQRRHNRFNETRMWEVCPCSPEVERSSFYFFSCCLRFKSWWGSLINCYITYIFNKATKCAEGRRNSVPFSDEKLRVFSLVKAWSKQIKILHGGNFWSCPLPPTFGCHLFPRLGIRSTVTWEECVFDKKKISTTIGHQG